MEYDDITVAVRQRGPRESIDLGFALTRRWWASVELGTLACLLPSALVFYLALSSQPLIALVAFWWFKPLYDRLPLFILSRAFFGQNLSLELIAETPRILVSRLFGDLTYRRFSPCRSYRLPVCLLEGLRGQAVRKRLKTITATGKLSAAGVTIVCLLFELLLAYGLFILVHIFSDYGPIGESIAILTNEPERLNSALTYWIYVLSVAFIEPFYVGAGFSLYVNRRINLEGWDLELIFRRLSERVGRTTGLRARNLAVALLVLGFVAQGARAWADPIPGGDSPDALIPPPPTIEEIETALQEVFDHEEFGSTAQQTVWRPKWQKKNTRERRGGNIEQPLLSGFATWIARITPWVLGGIAVFLGGYMLVVTRGKRLASRRKSAADSQKDLSGAGQDPDKIEPELLPEDWLGAATKNWQAGKRRTALSLLYRGGLAAVSDRGGIEIPDSATEMECLRRVKRIEAKNELIDRSAEFLEGVVRLWLREAYAREPVGQSAFDDLCASGKRLSLGVSLALGERLALAKRLAQGARLTPGSVLGTGSELPDGQPDAGGEG